MNKVKGTITGMLLGIIASTLWIYRDTLVHPDCNSVWKCSSSALFKFGVGWFMLIVAVIMAVSGFIIGFYLDKKINKETTTTK